MNEHQFKVGDKLAFQMYGSWVLHSIRRITPTGRIIAGPYTLNPNLTVRGRSALYGPFKGHAVTPDIEEDIRRTAYISTIKAIYSLRLRNCSTETLQRLAEIAETAYSECSEHEESKSSAQDR